jgi:hypothetical protein
LEICGKSRLPWTLVRAFDVTGTASLFSDPLFQTSKQVTKDTAVPIDIFQITDWVSVSFAIFLMGAAYRYNWFGQSDPECDSGLVKIEA